MKSPNTFLTRYPSLFTPPLACYGRGSPSSFAIKGVSVTLSSLAAPAPAAKPRHPLVTLAIALLALMGLAALVSALIGTGQAPDVLLNVFTTRFLGIFIEAVPFLILGSLVSGLIEAYVRTEDILRLLPRNPVLATLSGVFMGIIFPVCECGVVPVVRRLYLKGLPISVGLTFLMAAPVMNPIVFASTYIAYGFGPIFWGRFIITFIVAATIGLIFAFTARARDVVLPHIVMSETGWEGMQPRRSWQMGIRASLMTATSEFFEMGRYLVIGCLLAAGLQTLVPQDTLFQIGQGPILSALVLLVLAFVLSVCSTVDAFVSLAFSLTFPAGSIMGFLAFGPMVDIKSTLMFRGIFKPRIVFYLILLPFLMNWVIASVINMTMGTY